MGFTCPQDVPQESMFLHVKSWRHVTYDMFSSTDLGIFAAEARLELRPSWPHWLQWALHFASAGLRALRSADAVAPWAPTNLSNLRVMKSDIYLEIG